MDEQCCVGGGESEGERMTTNAPCHQIVTPSSMIKCTT